MLRSAAPAAGAADPARPSPALSPAASSAPATTVWWSILRTTMKLPLIRKSAFLGGSAMLFLALVARAACVSGWLRPVRIAGGSMAETLLGDHWRIRCPQCGIWHRCDVEQVPQDQRVVCPNCGRPHDADRAAERVIGQRVLIDRWPALRGDWQSRRGAMVAIRRADSPSGFAVKRLIGVPGETISIVDGDVWLGTNKLYRKTWAELLAVAIPIHDDRFRAVLDLAADNDDQGLSKPDTKTRPAADDPVATASLPVAGSDAGSETVSKLVSEAVSNAANNAGSETVGAAGRRGEDEGAAEIRGVDGRRAEGRWAGWRPVGTASGWHPMPWGYSWLASEVPPSGKGWLAFQPASGRGVIRDFDAYNQALSRHLEPVNDLVLRFDAVLDDLATLELVLRPARRPGVRFEISRRSGCRIWMLDESSPRLVGNVPLPVIAHAGHRRRIGVAHCDRQAILAVNDRELARIAWESPSPFLANARAQPALRNDSSLDSASMVAIGAAGGRVEIRALWLARDIHYLPASAPGSPRLWRLAEDEWFVLGDNAAASTDSRDWGSRRVLTKDLTGVVRTF